MILRVVVGVAVLSMCGRFVRYSSPETFAELLEARGALNLAPSYNVAPSESVLVARNGEEGGRELALLHWGLIPSWSKEPKTSFSTINARAETVDTKPTFQHAIRRRRCLIGSDGYYEWKKLASTSSLSDLAWNFSSARGSDRSGFQ